MADSDLTSVPLEVAGTITPATAWYSEPSAALLWDYIEPGEAAPGWAAEVMDRAGVSRGAMAAREIRITRTLNAGMTAQLTGVRGDDGAAEIRCAERGVTLYRRGVARFRGIAAVVRDLASSDAASVAVEALDPLAALASRHRREESQGRFAGVDAGEIAWALVEDEDAAGETHLRRGTIGASVTRDREYAVGKQLLEAIVQLAEVDDGFYVIANPRLDEDDPAAFAELEIRWPTAGALRSGARFEYGADTIGNVETIERETTPPINRVLALGAGDGDAQLRAVAEDLESQAIYGVWSATVSFSDVTIAATLEQHAREALRPAPRTTYTIRPTPRSVVEDDEGDSVPMLWDDFDVGDTIAIRARDDFRFDPAKDLDVDTAAVVISATVAVSDDGLTERLEELVVSVTGSA